MDRPNVPLNAQSEIQFLLSLLNISAPGQPVSQQTLALEKLLPAAMPR